MIYKEIIQGSFEWKELRYRKLGGTANAKVMTNLGKPVEDNAIFLELFGDYCEDYEFEEERFLPAHIVRGNELEPVARFEFMRIYNKKVFEIGWSESSDFTGISPDGIVGDEAKIQTILDVEEAFETKCPTKAVYAKYLLDNSLAISDYAWQLVTYFKEYPNLKLLNFFIFRPENLIQPHILIKIHRSDIIPVDKKKRGVVSDLCIELDVRQKELNSAVENRILKFKESKNQY